MKTLWATIAVTLAIAALPPSANAEPATGTWLAGVVSFLSADPVGAHMVERYPASITVASPIAQYPGALGYADPKSRSIWIDPAAIQSSAVPVSDRDALAACTLVHEAAHLRYPRAEHDIAMLYGYLCMDRLGASQYLKDVTYERIRGVLSSSVPVDREHE